MNRLRGMDSAAHPLLREGDNLLPDGTSLLTIRMSYAGRDLFAEIAARAPRALPAIPSPAGSSSTAAPALRLPCCLLNAETEDRSWATKAIDSGWRRWHAHLTSAANARQHEMRVQCPQHPGGRRRYRASQTGTALVVARSPMRGGWLKPRVGNSWCIKDDVLPSPRPRNDSRWFRPGHLLAANLPQRVDNQVHFRNFGFALSRHSSQRLSVFDNHALPSIHAVSRICTLRTCSTISQLLYRGVVIS